MYKTKFRNIEYQEVTVLRLSKFKIIEIMNC